MKRIGILVVAYNASATLAQVLDRIPRSFLPRIERVLVADDASDDDTYTVGLGYQEAATNLPLTVIRHPRNLGYGGNQKVGYRWAIDHGLDIVVLLHGDGQYAPELLPRLVEPLELDKCDAVFGSRMLTQGAARRGGMPLYKYLGNKVLTRIENTLVGTHLSEWHSGYRAYSVDALRDVPFERNSDEFDFDTQIIVQLHDAGKRIMEVPIPTFYGDEISYVNGMRYAKDIVVHVAGYRAQKMGFGAGRDAEPDDAGEDTLAGERAQGRIFEWLAERAPSRVLDLACDDGTLAAALRVHGHRVTGVAAQERGRARERMDRLVIADLAAGIPDGVGDGFDVILAGDALVYVPEPELLLREATALLAPGGSIVTRVPNFGHWYPRLRVVLGRFDYDQRGILDRRHLRFFTRRSFQRLAASCGLSMRRSEAVGVPLAVMERGAPGTRPSSAATRRLVARIDRFGVSLWPSLFGYEFVFELEPVPAI